MESIQVISTTRVKAPSQNNHNSTHNIDLTPWDLQFLTLEVAAQIKVAERLLSLLALKKVLLTLNCAFLTTFWRQWKMTLSSWMPSPTSVAGPKAEDDSFLDNLSLTWEICLETEVLIEERIQSSL
ncbi:hypothetical protein VNO78_26644 [Psophocarpus tetragonolobus]|uniref:Uncharacterized protein n=1 Tax=Psophocarpus tetragonolobus TaxID=3891 RepID=A0AAN9S042_PSOTE